MAILQNMGVLLRKARAERMAVGAFECWDSLNIQAVAIAAEQCRTPVIFQASAAEYRTIGGADALADIVTFFVRKHRLDAALHLDHGASLEEVDECLKAGFSSVMLDASSLPFADNVRLSAEASAMAHKCGASCEAELGHVGGGDGGGGESSLTVPGEAAEFVARTQVDCLAVSVGTVHGEYRGTPKLRFDRLSEIAQLTDLPLVLHGGSGTPPDQLRRAIDLGIAKINICTDINKAFLAGIRDAEGRLTPSVPGNFYRPAVAAVVEKTSEMIRLFQNRK